MESCFANSLPLNKSAKQALPHTVAILPETAWKNLKINKIIIFSEIAHKKLNILKLSKDIFINFLLPKASDIGPNIKGPKAKPRRKTVIVY